MAAENTTGEIGSASSAQVFLSHVAEEAPVAERLKAELERALVGARVFVSSRDVALGDEWLGKLAHAVDHAKALVVLCSPRSIEKPWLNFESGAGWSRRRPVVPVCHAGLTKEKLPAPLSMFQGLEIARADDCSGLVDRLADVLRVAVADSFDAAAMAASIAAADPSTAGRSRDVGIVLTHGQAEWSRTAPSVFELPRHLPVEFEGRWAFRLLDRNDDLMPARLGALSGLIVAMPFRSRLDSELIATMSDWVRDGGRMLLLGFELGDRHHDGNLGDLSRQFGIQGEADIVGPPGRGGTKPYGVPIDFAVERGDPHPLTRGLSRIRLADVQTLRVEPGGTEWLRVGDNVVWRPARESADYFGGILSQRRGEAWDLNERADWLSVAVEAPSGLCGKGGVIAIGTWDLLGRRELVGGDNLELLRRLFDWLSRSEPSATDGADEMGSELASVDAGERS
jgi:hypothetical protein